NCIEPKAFAFLEREKITVPPAIRERLRAARARIEAQNSQRLNIGRQLLSKLTERGVEVIILKGNFLSTEIYGDKFYKKMNDIDILVRKEDLPKVHQVYSEFGLKTAAALSGGDARAQEKYSHHWPPYFTSDLGCVIGTHWGIASPLSGLTIDYSALWNRRVPFEFEGLKLWALEPTDFLHHLALHLHFFKVGLRELADLYNLIRGLGHRVDWARLARDVAAYGSMDRVYHSLTLVNALSPAMEIQTILKQLEPSVSDFAKREAALRVREPGRILRSRTSQMSKIEKAFALFSLAERPAEKAFFLFKMWKAFLFPKPREIRRMNVSPEEAGPWALLRGYARGPYLISRVFAQDMGWKIYVLVTVGHHVKLAKSFFKFRADPLPKVFSRLGIEAGAIERMETVLE
ncbi:MAG: nucleotidyltransferase family protein, partial [Bdellovibrionia bacterium]